MIRKNEFSLGRLSLSSSVWYTTALLGWGLIGVAVARLVIVGDIRNSPAFVMSAAMLVVLELLPLVQGRGHDPQGVVMSTAFVCAMLFIWGPWPAVISVVIASLASDLRARKTWWKVLFNPAQYALSVGAGALAIRVLSNDAASLVHPLGRFHMEDLAWMPAAWTAYFLVNLVLVAGVLSWSQSVLEIVKDDFWHYTTMSYAVMALSPLVVLVCLSTWQLLPILLIPLLLLYYTSATSLEREHQAGHDTLTGLPNRVTLQFELAGALETYHRSEVPFGLMLIDLDDFKRVNDTLGHPVGDKLLVSYAARLRSLVRPSDLVARLGGDEFAVVVYDADRDDVVAVAERLLTSINDSIDLDGLSVAVEASIGIALCPDHGTDESVLLRRADVAMYAAKDGHTGFAVYSRENDSNSTDRLGMLAELKQALQDGTIEVYFQPQVTAVEGRPIGAEALVRWRHPSRGFIPPDEFIPLAERSGIMPLLTERVVTLALVEAARWRDAGMSIPVAVNVSAGELATPQLAPLIDRCLREHDMPAEMLQLEITERIATSRMDDARRTLSRLRELGVRISLDDFGTGYSSLLRLSALQVDEIKIDRGFVSAMTAGEQGVGIVRALIDLAHTLGMPSVAEGVETSEEMALLVQLGCDAVQGWYIARPMPREQMTQWLCEHIGGRQLEHAAGGTMLTLVAEAG